MTRSGRGKEWNENMPLVRGVVEEALTALVLYRMIGESPAAPA